VVKIIYEDEYDEIMYVYMKINIHAMFELSLMLLSGVVQLGSVS